MCFLEFVHSGNCCHSFVMNLRIKSQAFDDPVTFVLAAAHARTSTHNKPFNNQVRAIMNLFAMHTSHHEKMRAQLTRVVLKALRGFNSSSVTVLQA